MTHRSGWRDPLEDKDWEEIFYEVQPTPEVALLPLLWESLSEGGPLAAAARIPALPELAAAARRHTGLAGRQAVREAHMRSALAAADKLAPL